MNPDSITVLGADIYPVDIYEKIGVSWCEYRYPYPCETEEKSKEARESMREGTVGHNNYFYFVADIETGNVYYATTLEEHEALVAKYVNKNSSQESSLSSSETE